MPVQVAVPSRTDVREYQELKSCLDKLVGQINGRFSTANWSPVRYIYGCLSQQELAGFYRFYSIQFSHNLNYCLGDFSSSDRRVRVKWGGKYENDCSRLHITSLDCVSYILQDIYRAAESVA